MNPKLIDVCFLWKHLSGVVSNLERFPLTQQNENEIAYERKANGKPINCIAIDLEKKRFQSENLNEQTHQFSNEQNHKKSHSKITFRTILLFRQQK